MDYALLKRIFQAYLVDQTALTERMKSEVSDIEAKDSFEEKLLEVLGHIVDCFAVNESLKTIVREILVEADYFSKSEIHKTTKNKFLEKILKDAQYREKSRQFNLDAIQTYVAHVVQKQLHEINIKIEENQRSLDKLQSSVPIADRSSESTSLPSSTSTNRGLQKPSPKEEPRPSKERKEDASESLSLSPAQFLLVENEGKKCVIQYMDIIEILKFDKPVPIKILTTAQLPHHKLLAFNRRNVLKEVSNQRPDRKTILTNANAFVQNELDKHFGVVVRCDAGFSILFVDYIEYTEPISAYQSGDIARREDGEYPIVKL